MQASSGIYFGPEESGIDDCAAKAGIIREQGQMEEGMRATQPLIFLYFSISYKLMIVVMLLSAKTWHMC